MRETRLETVIEQVKRRRCEDKKPWIYDKNGEIKSSVIVGDVLPLLEEMKEYEINVSYEYIEDFFKKFNRGDTINGNTYNNNACISNDISWKALKTEDNCFFLIQIHLFGGIDYGYSDWFVLKMDNFHDFWELENWVQYKTINDRYSVDIYLNQEYYELIDNDAQENLGEYSSMTVDDLLAKIVEERKEIKIMIKKQKTNTQLKTIVQRALESKYGFAPTLKDIILLEANGTGEYILFEVNGKEYSFNSYMMGEGHPFPYSVWCGKGTITRKEVK